MYTCAWNAITYSTEREDVLIDVLLLTLEGVDLGNTHDVNPEVGESALAQVTQSNLLKTENLERADISGESTDGGLGERGGEGTEHLQKIMGFGMRKYKIWT